MDAAAFPYDLAVDSWIDGLFLTERHAKHYTVHGTRHRQVAATVDRRRDITEFHLHPSPMTMHTGFALCGKAKIQPTSDNNGPGLPPCCQIRRKSADRAVSPRCGVHVSPSTSVEFATGMDYVMHVVWQKRRLPNTTYFYTTGWGRLLQAKGRWLVNSFKSVGGNCWLPATLLRS